jgi:hypothetical protein
VYDYKAQSQPSSATECHRVCTLLVTRCFIAHTARRSAGRLPRHRCLHHERNLSERLTGWHSTDTRPSPRWPTRISTLTCTAETKHGASAGYPGMRRRCAHASPVAGLGSRPPPRPPGRPPRARPPGRAQRAGPPPRASELAYQVGHVPAAAGRALERPIKIDSATCNTVAVPYSAAFKLL